MQVQKWYKSDSGFYSKLITIMGKEGQLRLAMWLFGEMRKNGCRPDTSLYNSVIAAQVRSQDLGQGLEKAFKFFEEMKAKPRFEEILTLHKIQWLFISMWCRGTEVFANVYLIWISAWLEQMSAECGDL